MAGVRRAPGRPGDGGIRAAAVLLDRLDRARQRFGAADRADRRRALAALGGRRLVAGDLLLRFHEALCFMQAYPDGADSLRAVEAELARFVQRVAELPVRKRRVLDETGVAGTRAYCPLSYPAARWLAETYPDATELDQADGGTDEALRALLPLVVDGAREETLVDVGVSHWAWLRAAKGTDPRSDLLWLLDRVGARPGAVALYDQVQPRVRWSLRGGSGSRTAAKVPRRRVFFHHGPLPGRGRPLDRRLPGPPVPVRRAGAAEARMLLDAARAAVTVRYREVHAFNHADPGDVLVAAAGRGIEIAWLGVLPAHRLPLRGHYGYLVLKNGVPVGYGDASLLFDWCEVAYNVFETFRQGESAFVLFRLLGFVARRFGARAFHLSPYQIGHGNDEALGSGAFWFYHKLGFRPVRPDLSRLADSERRRIVADPAYRSPRATLARLAEGRMTLGAGSPTQPAVRDFDAARLVRRAAAAPVDAGAVARALGAGHWRSWPPAERAALEGLAPALGLIPGLARWPRGDRQALVGIARAKGRRPEAGYLRRLARHRRLRAAFLDLGGPGG